MSITSLGLFLAIRGNCRDYSRCPSPGAARLEGSYHVYGTDGTQADRLLDKAGGGPFCDLVLEKREMPLEESRNAWTLLRRTRKLLSDRGALLCDSERKFCF